MSDVQVRRRLVKSTPELWAACSDPETLGRHLQGFGDLRVTRLEPETTVAWEGESVRGTVVLEPSGWGTQVTFTVMPPAAPVEPAGPREPETHSDPSTPRGRVAGLLDRVVRTLRGTVRPAPSATTIRAAHPEPVAHGAVTRTRLTAALDSLGRAHHRPFSRG